MGGSSVNTARLSYHWWREGGLSCADNLVHLSCFIILPFYKYSVSLIVSCKRRHTNQFKQNMATPANKQSNSNQRRRLFFPVTILEVHYYKVFFVWVFCFGVLFFGLLGCVFWGVCFLFFCVFWGEGGKKSDLQTGLKPPMKA